MLRLFLVISACSILFVKVKPYIIDFYQKINEGPEIVTISYYLPLPPEPPEQPHPQPRKWRAECGSLLVPLMELDHISAPFNLHLTDPHEGIDLAAPSGSIIMASTDGTVSFMGWVSGYGRVIDIEHEDGYMTRYAHLKSFYPGIAVGKEVVLGEAIGKVGMSGHATGPHLHFELRKNGVPLNPIIWLGLRSCN